ncbi:MAG: glycine cleavage system aminomethyltransferase GcvT, partial [Anaerolineales bacterium]
PGDRSALNPSGLRLGTPWISQRGFGEAEVDELALYMATLLKACTPYTLPGRRGRTLYRAKVDFDVLNDVKVKVRDLAQRMGIDFEPPVHGYPHYYYIDDPAPDAEFGALEISGAAARAFLQYATSNDVEALGLEDTQATQLWTGDGEPVGGALTRTDDDSFLFTLPAGAAPRARAWLRDLSDGYIGFDSEDLHTKLPGPVVVRDHGPAGALPDGLGDPVAVDKPYYLGQPPISDLRSLPEFTWPDPQDAPLLKTALNDTHRALGAKMVPFAGWDMPVWYSSVSEEHAAVRNAAGLFDVSHMGVWEATGDTAASFLDSLCANDITALGVGESVYTHFLDPDANVIDDLLVYRRAANRYMMVVNASNDDKDWAWADGVREGRVLVDRARPWAKAFGRSGATLRNLRDPSSGADMRVDLALQGPASRDILLALGADGATTARIKALKRTQLCAATVGDFDLVVARTGYTGEPMSFELFVHPDRVVELWNRLLAAGQPLGLLPCGLAARDSTRTEAGLPLYGHEMGGELNLGVGEAGFGSYVKTYKPWFIGRAAYLARERSRTGEVVRFQFQEKGVRMAHLGDPVVDKRGRVIGTVTSCAIGGEGYLLGQAFVESKYTAPGTVLGVFQSASAKAEKPRAELQPGDRVRLHELAKVQSRFMRKK